MNTFKTIYSLQTEHYIFADKKFHNVELKYESLYVLQMQLVPFSLVTNKFKTLTNKLHGLWNPEVQFHINKGLQ